MDDDVLKNKSVLADTEKNAEMDAEVGTRASAEMGVRASAVRKSIADVPDDVMSEDLAHEDDDELGEVEELSAQDLLEIKPVSVPQMVIAGDEEHDDPLSEVYVLEEETPEEAAVPQPKKDVRSRYKIASAKEFFNSEILYRYDLLEETEKDIIKGRYRIELKGFQGGIWTVDAGQELTVANRSEEADVVLGMQQKDFLDLVNGELNPQLAMLSQKTKVVGDVKKAVFFQSVLAPFD